MLTRTMAKRTLLFVFATSLGCSSAFAQRGHDQGRGFDPHGGPHGHGDGPHFRGGAHEGAWRSGHWEHGRLRGGGRAVWWWAAGPPLYYYPTPVYPYPYAYSYPYPYAYSPAYDHGVPPPPSVSYWYYCDAAGGYYPYVTQCPGGFRTIAPSDPNAPAPTPPPGVLP